VPRSLAIVGASARSAAHSALRAGWQPIVADLFADADLQSVCPTTRIKDYPDGFFDWLNRTESDGWLYTGGLENHPALIDRMATRRPLLGNSGSVLQAIRSPCRLADALSNSGLLFPETRPCSRDDLHQPGAEDYLLKTYRQSSGLGVSGPYSGPDGWKQLALQIAAGKNDPLFLQQRVEGTACSATFIGWGAEATLLGITRQLVGQSWTGAAKYQYCGSIGLEQSCAPATHGQIVRIGNVLANRFGLRGLFGVDLMIDREQAWTIEVNPRYTAAVEILERATGIRAISWHAAACCQTDGPAPGPESMPPAASISEVERANTYGKVILFAKHKTAILQPFVDWALEQARYPDWPAVADIPAPGTVIEPHQPILSLFAKGRSLNQVEQVLRGRVARIEQRLSRVE
jgi:uncharacterized protein